MKYSACKPNRSETACAGRGSPTRCGLVDANTCDVGVHRRCVRKGQNDRMVLFAAMPSVQAIRPSTMGQPTSPLIVVVPP